MSSINISSPYFGLDLEEDMMMIRNINNNYNGDQKSNITAAETSNSLLLDESPTSFHDQQGRRVRHDEFSTSFFSSPASFGGYEDKKKVKKMDHNANERDRRKKINDLYSSLRSLLPQTDQIKRLSIPGTIAYVLKYIPELQKELESLQQKKKILLKKQMAKQENSCHEVHVKDNYALRSSSVISTTRLSDEEIMIQISTVKGSKGSFTKILLYLEQNGFILQDSSSFVSFQERVFYNLHLQVKGIQVSKDLEELKEKLSNLLCEKHEEPLMQINFGSNDPAESFF